SAKINTTGHPEDVSTESHEIIPIHDDHAHEHVAELTEEDFPHVPNSQADVVESTAITVDHAIVTNGANSTIPIDGAPTLVVDAIPSELQLEIGESSSFVPAEITMNPSAENGRSLAMVPHEDAPLPSPDQISGMHIYPPRRLPLALPLLPHRPGPYQILGLRHYFGHIEMEISCLWRTKMREPSSRPPVRLWRVLAFFLSHARRL
ncbi:unnamed protein product, partial [Prunus brigantina]